MLGFLDRWPGMGSLENIIKSVVWEFHWTPFYIDELFIDDIDHHGLIYWYDFVLEREKEINKKHGS